MSIFNVKKTEQVWSALPKQIRESIIEEAQASTQIYNTFDYSARGLDEVTFDTLRKIYSWVPQIASSVDSFHEMIVGSKIAINADDEEAKKVCEDFSNNIDLYGKMRPMVKTMLVCGVSLAEKIGNGKNIENIEEIDILSVYDKKRDQFGDTIHYVLHSTDKESIIKPKKVIEFGFNQFSREKWARSVFHTLAVPRSVGSRKHRPMAENLILQEDVMVAVQQNFAYPERWYVFRGADKDKLEKEGRKIKEQKPGDKIITSEPPEVIDQEVSAAGKFDSYVKHLDQAVMMGCPFPTELMTGDFTSRASSNVTLQVVRQKVKAYQQYICNKLKKELFEVVLYGHESGKWNTPEKIQKANLQIAFEANTPNDLTPEQVRDYVNNSTITRDEAREYLKKTSGIDLFDDALVKQQQDLYMKQKMDATKTEPDSNDNRDNQLKKMKESIKICELCSENQHTLCIKKGCKCKHV